MSGLGLIATDPGTAEPRGGIGELMIWLGILAVAACVGVVIIHLLRRWLGRPVEAPGEGFTLQELRRMHAEGRLSDEEFQRARASILRSATAAAGADERKIGPSDPDAEA